MDEDGVLECLSAVSLTKEVLWLEIVSIHLIAVDSCALSLRLWYVETTVVS
jgi:hypothetical protein